MKKKITLTPRYDNGIKYAQVLANIRSDGSCYITVGQRNAAERRMGLIDGDYPTMAPWDKAVYGSCDVYNRDGVIVQTIS